MAGTLDRDPLRTLHLVRHAHAGDAGRWAGPDATRPLTEHGHDQAARLGALLAGADVRPDLIVTSPKVRAHQTAQAIATALGSDLRIDDRLAGGIDLDGLDRLLADTGAREPMLVGHDPDLSMLLDDLMGTVGQEMRKGAIASLRVWRPLEPGAAMLRWLIPPEVLPPLR
ncbi:MAG: histidine phosphatase family protein [Chloroflexi bacterium]|nr:histidine phosphatase family protein [Chloroflexota bacterium]